MGRRTILVAGATGIVGSAAVEYFCARPDYDVVALSRRAPGPRPNLRHVAADLTDAAACRRALADVGDVGEVLYAALHEKPDLVAGWRDSDQMAVNLAMLRNLLDALERGARNLRHITVMQGTKAYGMHSTQVPVPAKERWPRAPHQVFYWAQEDLLRERQRHADWRFTVLRPQLILGSAVGSPMNVVAAIGVYASILRELGQPLSFPGGGRYVHAASDSRLIAQAAEFAATSVSGNETFNIVNGDMLVWQDVWPAIARHFSMAVGDPRPMRLADEMPRHEALWARLVVRHSLRPLTMTQLLSSSWQFTDRTFGVGLDAPPDRIVSPIKLFKAGFAHCEDTEDSLVHWLTRLQQERLIPH